MQIDSQAVRSLALAVFLIALYAARGVLGAEEDLFDETPLEISLDEENMKSNDVTEDSLPHEDPDYKDEDDSLQGESCESEDQDENSMDTEHNSPVSQDRCHAGLSEETEATPTLSPEAEQTSSEAESKLSCVLCKKPMKGPTNLISTR